MTINIQNKAKYILPLTLLALLFLFQTFTILNYQYTKQKNLEELKSKLEVAVKLSNALHELQKERGLAVGYLSSRGLKFKNQLQAQVKITNKNIKRLYILNNLDSFKKLVPYFTQLKELRLKVKSLSISATKALSLYTNINNEILKLMVNITKNSSMNEISQNLIAFVNFQYFKENAGIERATGMNILLSKGKKRALLRELHTLIVKQNVYENIFLQYSQKSFIRYYKTHFRGDAIDNVTKLREMILNENYTNTSKINAHIWFNATTKKIDRLKLINDKLSQNIMKYINNELERTRQKIYIFMFLNVIISILYLFIIYLIFKFIKEDKVQKNLINKHIIVSSTDTKGIITSASEAFCAISGYTQKELIGQPHNKVRHPDMPKEVFQEMWATVKSGKTWRGTIKNLAKDGSYYWVDSTIEPIFGNNGKVVSYMAVRQNITDKIELDLLNHTLEDKVNSEVNKNREKDKAMFQQSRLAQMGEMMSMIAHQWRQPLTAISAASGNLILKAKLNRLDNKSVEDLSEKISEYAQHLSATIDDFRDFFKPNKEKTKTSYNEIIESVLSIVETSIKNNNIDLKQKLENNIEFYTYQNELKQVVLNLLKNAEDVLKEKAIENPVIIIEADGYTLRVKDNAGGVPEDIIDKIFDPYFSTKTEKDGTGLGLYMSKTIIEEHCGGKLSVYNDDEGAVFNIELPTDSKNNE